MRKKTDWIAGHHWNCLSSFRITGLLLCGIVFPVMGYTHGLEHLVYSEGIIGIQITYGDGVPLTTGQAVVYSPDSFEIPVMELSLDPLGRVFFQPDKEGEWIIVVKDGSGHSHRVNITVNQDMVTSKTVDGSLSFFQKLIMALAVVWGFIGTALFFAGKRSEKTAMNRK